MKFGKAVVKSRIAILIISAVLLVPSLLGMINTRVNYDMLNYLPDSLWRILADRQSQQGAFSESIFPNLLKPECPLNPSRAYRQLKKLLEIGGLPSIRFHDLRHTFTSHAANSGIAPKTLSEIVGHTKASFTLDHYAHVTSDMQKNAANIVTNYITDILGKELKPWQSEEKRAKDR